MSFCSMRPLLAPGCIRRNLKRYVHGEGVTLCPLSPVTSFVSTVCRATNLRAHHAMQICRWETGRRLGRERTRDMDWTPRIAWLVTQRTYYSAYNTGSTVGPDGDLSTRSIEAVCQSID